MGDIIYLAKNKQDPTWWVAGPSIQWSAERHPELPVLEATGRILLWDEEDDSAEEPTIEAGRIRIAKPYLWAGIDPLLAMDDISSDYETLASSVLDSGCYDDEFTVWFEGTFGVFPNGEPIFIDDIHIESRYRNPRDPLAAQAVIEAAAAFGSCDSVIIGFGFEAVRRDSRDKYRAQGLWDWEGPLGAKPWRNVLVAPRPQG